MRVFQFIDTLRSGGKERQLVELLKWLIDVPGLENELIIMSDVNHYSYLDELRIPTHRLIRKSKRDPYVFTKLYRLLLKRKPDIIHSWDSMCSVYALPVLKILGIKFVNNFIRDAPSNFCYRDKNWIRAKLTFPFSDKIVANSYAGLKSYNIPEKKAFCIRNGFDFSRVDGLASKDDTRGILKIFTKYVVGMVASFSDKKDYNTFIKSANLILDKRDDVTFVAVGDGKKFKSTKHEILPKFKDRIKFLGKQKRVLNVINIFDIGVLSTFTEGISNVIMEYMSLKKPTIATDCDGNREIVEHGRTGFLVDPANPYQISEKILLLLDRKELSEKLGQNGYDKLKKEFSLDAMGIKFLHVYKDLISESKFDN